MWKKLLSSALAVMLLTLSVLHITAYCAGSRVEVDCFYFNACGACDPERDLRDVFGNATGGALEETEASFVFHNTFLAAEEARFKQTCERLAIPPEQRTLPMLIIGDTVLSGQAQIQSGLADALANENKGLSGIPSATGPNTSAPVYFYVSPCEDCEKVKEFLGSLQQSYLVEYRGERISSALSVEAHNVADPQGLELARKYYEAWGVPESRQKVPVIFLRDGYLSGVDEIRGGLEQAILDGRCIGIEPPGAETGIKPYEWPGIFLAGLINGFNPCSISMLLFLIALLLARNASVLKLGMAFITGKTVAYLLLGTVLFGVLRSIDGGALALFQTVGKILLLVLSLAVAAVNLSDFVAAKNEKYNQIRMQLPAPLRKANHTLIRRLTGCGNEKLLILAVFSLGLLISVGEFLCTGQIYLATILYMIRRSAAFDVQTVGMFLVYIAGMMIPLLAVTLAVWKGRSVFDVSELARRHMPVVKLLSAAVFAAFGILVILSF